MKFQNVAVGFLAGCAATGLAAMTFSPQDPAEMEKMMQQMQEAMEKYAVPGEQHAEMAKRAGAWKAELKFWQAPGAPAETMYGDANFEMIMEGRYMIQHFSGDFQGQPFEGAGLTGYDRMKNEYQSIWVDNMSTAVMWMTGKSAGGQCNFKGEMPDIMQGKYVNTRSTEKMPDENTVIMEMYAPGPDGKEYKSMEITYTRAQD